MKCQSLFSKENKKNIMNVLSAEVAHRVVKFSTNRGKQDYTLGVFRYWFLFFFFF